MDFCTGHYIKIHRRGGRNLGKNFIDFCLKHPNQTRISFPVIYASRSIPGGTGMESAWRSGMFLVFITINQFPSGFVEISEDGGSFMPSLPLFAVCLIGKMLMEILSCLVFYFQALEWSIFLIYIHPFKEEGKSQKLKILLVILMKPPLPTPSIFPCFN